jgi:hypothetical protein
MNQNSWLTPGIITSCKHKRELYKELQKNNNPTVLLIIQILSMVTKNGKKINITT